MSSVTFAKVAESAERVALILAEETYDSYATSPSGAERGEAIADQLEKLGFEIQMQIAPGDAGARAALRRFATRAADAEIAVAALVGHVVSSRGTAFMLPKNANIRRSTDLLSRGISIPSVALITARASEAGAVLVLATQADIPSTFADAVSRPEHSGAAIKGATIAFSGSPKAPVSTMNASAADAMDRIAKLEPMTTVMLADLVSAVGGGSGMMVGAPPEIALREPPPPPKPEPKPEPPVASTDSKPAETEPAEVAAATPTEPSAEELLAALRTEVAARNEATPDESTETPAPDAAATDAEPAPEAPVETPAAAQISVSTLETLEGMLGWRQKSMLQRRLREPGYYKGPIDGIFGPKTRQAIKDYQTELGAEVTGFLTPTQIEQLSTQ